MLWLGQVARGITQDAGTLKEDEVNLGKTNRFHFGHIELKLFKELKNIQDV